MCILHSYSHSFLNVVSLITLFSPTPVPTKYQKNKMKDRKRRTMIPWARHMFVDLRKITWPFDDLDVELFSGTAFCLKFRILGKAELSSMIKNL